MSMPMHMSLPEPEIVITVDELLVTPVAAALLPEVDMVVELAPGETSIEPADEQLPLPVAAPLIDGAPLVKTPPVVIPGPVTPGPTAEDNSTGHPALHRRNVLPEVLHSVRPDQAQQSGDTQLLRSAEHTVTLVPPAAMAERSQTHQRRVPETLAAGETTDDVARDTRRPVVATVAAPVVERLADMMRTRVRPTQFAPVTHGQAQQAAFQPLATSSPLPDSSFATTLQQQGTDLIRTPVMEPAWGDRIGERVVMLAGQQLKSAEIRLTPAELGPVRVRVSVEDGAANVTFHAQHALTRDALEQALPRLREMLAESGLSLAQADVGDHGVAQGNRDGDGDAEASVAGLGGEDVDTPAGDIDTSETPATVTANGLVDTFA